MVAIIAACIYVLVGSSVLRVFEQVRSFEAPSVSGRYVYLAVGFLVSLIVHEAGHRIAGAAMGWHCFRFGVGPFEFSRDGKGWKSRRVTVVWGAFVSQVPANFGRFRAQKAITLLSGPMSSLVFGLIFFGVAAAASDSATFGLFGRLALVTSLGTLELIPRLTKSGIGSDGYRLWELIRGGEAMDEMQWSGLAEASNATPLRHRDWPHALLIRLAERGDAYFIYLAYLHSMDAGDEQAAAAYMRRLIAGMPEENPSPYYSCEAVYWLAMFGSQAEDAAKWMNRVGEQPIDPETRLRAEAALAFANGQSERAITLAKEALSLISDQPATGSSEYAANRLRYLLNTLERQPTEPVSVNR